MPNISFAIEFTYEDRMPDSQPLAARTETQAVKELRKYLASANLPEGALVFLGFHRSSDGQHGYINPGGASPVGKPWNA